MEYENNLSAHHVTVDITAKTQTTENKQIDELLTQTSGSPSAQNGNSSTGTGTGTGTGTVINLSDLVSQAGDLPTPGPLIIPNEDDPYSPPKQVELVPAKSPSEPLEPSEPSEPLEPSEPSGSGSSSDSGSSSRSSLGPGPIAGIVIAVVAVIVIAIILIYIFVIKPKRESSTSNAGDVKSAIEKNEASDGL